MVAAVNYAATGANEGTAKAVFNVLVSVFALVFSILLYQSGWSLSLL